MAAPADRKHVFNDKQMRLSFTSHTKMIWMIWVLFVLLSPHSELLKEKTRGGKKIQRVVKRGTLVPRCHINYYTQL